MEKPLKWIPNGLDRFAMVLAEIEYLWGLIPLQDYNFPTGFSPLEQLSNGDYRFLALRNPSNYPRWRYPASRITILNRKFFSQNDINLPLDFYTDSFKKLEKVIDPETKNLVYFIPERNDIISITSFNKAAKLAERALENDGIFIHAIPRDTAKKFIVSLKKIMSLSPEDIQVLDPLVEQDLPDNFLWLWARKNTKYTNKKSENDTTKIGISRENFSSLVDASIAWEIPGPLDIEIPKEQTLIFKISSDITSELTQESSSPENVVLEYENATRGTDFEKFPSLPMRLFEIKDILFTDKDSYKIYEEKRKLLFPSSGYGSTTFWNRAGDKLYEIIMALGIAPAKRGFKRGKKGFNEGENYKFVDLAGGPGAFSQVLLQLGGKNTKGWGMTLREDTNNIEGNILWYPDLLRSPNFTAYWGPNNDGNLYSRDNIDGLVNDVVSFHDKKLKVKYVVADGGFDVKGNENNQEILSSKLITSEFYAAFRILDLNGHFICKMFDNFSDAMRGLIMISTTLFEETFIVKPRKSRIVNSERYFVGKSFKGFPDKIREVFHQILYSIEEPKIIFSAINTNNDLLKSISVIGERQIVAMRLIKELL